jgi:LuxR family maltose regulon positive regulatory protein
MPAPLTGSGLGGKPMTRRELSLRTDVAKFRPAPLRQWSIARQRLIDLLRREAASAQAILIEAPPGYGKSMFMRQWLDDRKSQGWECAWLSLEIYDDDPSRLAALLISAVGEFCGDWPTLGMSGASDLRSVVDHLISRDFSDRPLALFVDDFHHIANAEIREAFSRLIEYCSAGFQLVIASRTQLPLTKNRSRLCGLAFCLQEADLALDESEAEHLLAKFCAEPLEPSTTRRLRHRTRGWAAMLQLAGLAIAESDDPKKFIDEFSGGDTEVSKYLCEVMLDLQPREIRRFLLSTAVLDIFSADLCDAILGTENARALVSEIDSRRLLLERQDRRQEWCKYHAIFREFLLSRLDIELPGERRRLLRKAGQWFYNHGEIALAVEHALRGEDHESAALFASAHVLDIALRRGEFTIVQRWISGLPTDILDRYPSLKLGLAWAFIFLHRHGEARELVASVEASIGNQGQEKRIGPAHVDSVLATCLVIRGVNAAASDDHEEAAKIFRVFDRHTDRSLLNERALAATASAYGALAFGWVREAKRLSQEADELIAVGDFRYADGWNRIVKAMQALSEDRLDCVAGELTNVSVAFERDSLITKLLSICRAEALYRLGALDEAHRAIADAGEAAFAHVTLELGEMATRTMARIALANDRFDEALAILTQGIKAAESFGLSRLSDLLAGELVCALLRAGRTRDAWEVDKKHRLSEPVTEKFPSSMDSRTLTRARLALSRGDADRAMRLARALLNRAKPMHNLGLEIPALCLAGAAFDRLGDREQARRLVTQARMTAEQRRLCRLFQDEDYLFHSSSNAGQAFVGNEPVNPVLDGSPGLSNREGHILTLISQGMTNRDIAFRLVLSEETVKWHFRNISKKLSARNRTHAVQIAQRSGLLSSV